MRLIGQWLILSWAWLWKIAFRLTDLTYATWGIQGGKGRPTMGGVFDRLNSKLEAREMEGGISALDLKDLPPGLRKVMRLMLREVEMGYPAICEAMEAMPEAERLSRSELDQALEQLHKQGWLIKLGEERITYKVNLRRKAGSTLAQGFWNSLDKKIEESKSAPKPEGDTE
jgi:hypothetical protein